MYACMCERKHICVYMCILCACCGMDIEVSGCLAQLFLFFYLVASGDQTQGIRHGSKYGPSCQPTIAHHIYYFSILFLHPVQQIRHYLGEKRNVESQNTYCLSKFGSLKIKLREGSIRNTSVLVTNKAISI